VIGMMRTLLSTLLMAALTGVSLSAQDSVGIRFKISRDTVVAGVRCAPTGRAHAVVYPTGRLDECPIAMDTAIAGHTFARGTWIRLDEEGVLKSVWLSKPLVIQGLPCRGTGYKGWAVTFHANGALALCFLEELTTIDGVPCAAAAFLRELTGNSGVSMSDRGRLRSCRLARDFERGGTRHQKGSRITIDG
jgi:hypothetical protein